ncbi:hypothetical protein OSTOST_20830, partial [Ostertagia ostertagi]
HFYWRSIILIGALLRATHLQSDDERDRTQLASSFRAENRKRQAIGGDYICAHWRRRDFVRAHGKELPSIEGTAKQLNELHKKLGVSRVFLATDAPEAEVDQLAKLVTVPVLRFHDAELLDGAVAIVDQVRFL